MTTASTEPEPDPAPLFGAPPDAPSRGRPPAGTAASERSEAQRMALIHAAAHTFAEQGYFDSSVEDVVIRAGMSRATFYRFFENREDILASVYEESFRRIRRVVSASVDADGAPLAQLESALTTYVEILAADPGLARVLLVESRAVGGRVAAAHQRSLDALADNLTGLLGVLQEAGQIWIPDPLVPRILVDVVFDLAARCASEGRDPHEVIALAIELYLRLLGPPPPTPPAFITGAADEDH